MAGPAGSVGELGEVGETGAGPGPGDSGWAPGHAWLWFGVGLGPLPHGGVERPAVSCAGETAVSFGVVWPAVDQGGEATLRGSLLGAGPGGGVMAGVPGAGVAGAPILGVPGAAALGVGAAGSGVPDAPGGGANWPHGGAAAADGASAAEGVSAGEGVSGNPGACEETPEPHAGDAVVGGAEDSCVGVAAESSARLPHGGSEDGETGPDSAGWGAGSESAPGGGGVVPGSAGGAGHVDCGGEVALGGVANPGGVARLGAVPGAGASVACPVTGALRGGAAGRVAS